MKRSIFFAALAGMALAAAPVEARAQVSAIAKPVQIGIAGGAALPTSDLSETTNTGFNGTLTVGFNPALVVSYHDEAVAALGRVRSVPLTPVRNACRLELDSARVHRLERIDPSYIIKNKPVAPPRRRRR